MITLPAACAGTYVTDCVVQNTLIKRMGRSIEQQTNVEYFRLPSKRQRLVAGLGLFGLDLKWGPLTGRQRPATFPEHSKQFSRTRN
jgi:hypothetical protein